MTLRIDDGPLSGDDRDRVKAGLRAFNRRHMPAGEPEPLEFVVRDAAGAVQGGLLAETRWHWLSVHMLWLADEYRGRGYGRALLARAEAVGRGCRFAVLDTAAFQAPHFYAAAGYRPFGDLHDLPPGSRTIYLVKDLAVDEPAGA